MTINSSTSSIYAHQDLLNSSAHNIANSNTKNFGRIDTNITEASKNTVQAVSQKTQNEHIYSNTDLVKEITDQILTYQAVGANSVSIQTQDQVSGTLLDIKA
jgi:flagellar hook protein FlgE